MSPSTPPLRVVESIWYGAFHVPFNAGILEALGTAFPNRRFVFASEAEHGRGVRAMLPPALAVAVEFVDLRGAPFGDLWETHRADALGGTRPLRAAWRAYRLLNRVVSVDEGATDLVLTSATPSLLLAARAIHARRHGPRAVEVVVHGTLAQLDDDRSRRPLRRALDLRSTLGLWVRGGESLTVLGGHIPAEAARRLPVLATPGTLKVLPHPTLGTPPADGPGVPPPPVQIGFPGVITEAKGAPIFLRLARHFVDRPDVRFRLCGFMPVPDPDLDFSVVDDPVATEPVSRERYEAVLDDLHYICLPLPGRYYDLAASGTVIDAILHLKPLITLDGALTRRLFAEGGDIGHLCSDEADLHRTVDGLIRAHDPARYHAQVEALRRLRNARRPEALAPILRECWFRDGPPPVPPHEAGGGARRRSLRRNLAVM